MIKNNSKQSGFSLIETLVSISILLIVIVGPMSISNNSAKGSSFSNEQVTAFFLAQEGAELAQKGRDDLVIKGFLPVYRYESPHRCAFLIDQRNLRWTSALIQSADRLHGKV